MKEVNNLSIQRVTRETDLQSLIELFRICLSIDIDEEYFRWKYFNNPAGDVIAYAAISDNRIVSFYGVIPEWYWIENKKKIVFQAVDLVTHPDFRRLGLFARIAKLTHDAVGEKDPGFMMIAFPSAQSYPGFVGKLNGKALLFWKYFFCYEFMFRLFIWGEGKIKYSFHEINEISSDLTNYLEAKGPTSKIDKYWDEKIFAWKVFENRFKKIKTVGIYAKAELIGYCLYFFDSPKSCQILQIDSRDKIEMDTFLRQLLNYLFLETGKRCVYCWDPLRVRIRTSLMRAGFLQNPFRRGPFHHELPFILLAAAPDSIPPVWVDKENYNFQGIMLD